jgi:hypothetical protein
VERLPTGRQVEGRSPGSRARSRRAWGRVALLAGAATLASFALPAVSASAAPVTKPVSLKALLAKATKLANQIDSLSEQYDGLKIQLTEAKTEARIAREAALRDARQLTAGQVAVGQIAAQGYMNGSFDPALQLLQSSDPQAFVSRASIMLQIQQENGDKVTDLAAAEAAAERARLTAQQEASKAAVLAAQMKTKVKAIQRRENVLNSAAFARAIISPLVPMAFGPKVELAAPRLLRFPAYPAVLSPAEEQPAPPIPIANAADRRRRSERWVSITYDMTHVGHMRKRGENMRDQW